MFSEVGMALSPSLETRKLRQVVDSPRTTEQKLARAKPGIWVLSSFATQRWFSILYGPPWLIPRTRGYGNQILEYWNFSFHSSYVCNKLNYLSLSILHFPDWAQPSVSHLLLIFLRFLNMCVYLMYIFISPEVSLLAIIYRCFPNGHHGALHGFQRYFRDHGGRSVVGSWPGETWDSPTFLQYIEMYT